MRVPAARISNADLAPRLSPRRGDAENLCRDRYCGQFGTLDADLLDITPRCKPPNVSTNGFKRNVINICLSQGRDRDNKCNPVTLRLLRFSFLYLRSFRGVLATIVFIYNYLSPCIFALVLITHTYTHTDTHARIHVHKRAFHYCRFVP